jgi:integrase
MSNEIIRIEGSEVLPEQVRTYVRDAVSENTRRAYRADLDHFTAWGGSVPASPEIIARYLSDHAEVLSIATLKRRLAALSVAHEARGLTSPTSTKLVHATLRGIQRTHGTPQRQAQPLLVEDLLRIMATLGEGSKDVRDRALLLVGFAGGFRRSELVDLDVEDMEMMRQGMIITVRRSKTDQTGEGRKIGIPLARGRYCPVQTYEHWIETAGIETGPIFRPVTRHDHVGGGRLSTRSVSTIIKARVKAIGLDADQYSGHSLRAGLATSAAMAGISTLAIRQQTGHRSDATLARYVRRGELFINNAAGSLL